MNTVTAREIILKVLQLLGVVGAGQTASAEEYAVVKQNLEATVAELRKRRVVGLEAQLSTDLIPKEYFLPISHITAFRSASDFGLGGETYAAFLTLSQKAETDIKNMRHYERLPQPLASDYF